MTDLSLSEIEAVATRHPDLFQQGGLRRFLPVFVVAAVAAYLGYVWVFFDVSKVLDRADWEIAGNYLADWIAYEIRPDLHLEDGYISVSYPRYSPLGSDPHPEWVILERADVTIKEVVDAPQDATSAQTQSGFMVNAPVVPEAGNAVADPLAVPTKPSGFMGAGGLVGTKVDEAAPTEVQTRMSNEVVSAQVEIGDAVISVYPDHTEIDRANGERLLIRTSLENGVTAEGALPDWAEQKEVGGKIRMFFGFAGRVEVENDDVKVRRRFLGWENFFFDTRSAFWGKTLGEVVQMILSSEEIVPGKANWQVAYSDIANNSEWQHGDVWTKLLQTIVMAFMGTLLASMTAFPLAFLAARNISPNLLLNQGLKRLFDFLRSVDMLIWALVFTRTFGPGPLAGISAIFFTDTGTFGKLYSEALENIDDKQREGVRSVGAAPVLVQKYGVVPQVLPVFLSQALYFWESNTRSATIIGAVGAGGIGLKLWEAMRTNQDWENVAYMVVLILIVVFVFDNISGALRKRLVE